MIKVKHQRTADCAVAGFRWHKNGPGTHIGSLLLGLFDDAGTLHSVGVDVVVHVGQASRARRGARAAPRERRSTDHPWARVGGVGGRRAEASGQRLPGATSRWNRGKDLSWEPLRLERVAEVAYDHLQGDRFRHGTTFLRWRPDKRPEDCRYDQLEETAAFELQRIFGGGGSSQPGRGGTHMTDERAPGRAAGARSGHAAGAEPTTSRLHRLAPLVDQGGSPPG